MRKTADEHDDERGGENAEQEHPVFCAVFFAGGDGKINFRADEHDEQKGERERLPEVLSNDPCKISEQDGENAALCADGRAEIIVQICAQAALDRHQSE